MHKSVGTDIVVGRRGSRRTPDRPKPPVRRRACSDERGLREVLSSPRVMCCAKSGVLREMARLLRCFCRQRASRLVPGCGSQVVDLNRAATPGRSAPRAVEALVYRSHTWRPLRLGTPRISSDASRDAACTESHQTPFQESPLFGYDKAIVGTESGGNGCNLHLAGRRGLFWGPRRLGLGSGL